VQHAKPRIRRCSYALPCQLISDSSEQAQDISATGIRQTGALSGVVRDGQLTLREQ
jgi:hypothetical protein